MKQPRGGPHEIESAEAVFMSLGRGLEVDFEGFLERMQPARIREDP